MEKRDFISIEEAAEYCCLPSKLFLRLVKRRIISCYMPAKDLYLFKKEDLDAFLDGSRIPSRTEMLRHEEETANVKRLNPEENSLQ